MNFKKWVKSIQTAGYNGARTVVILILLGLHSNGDYGWLPNGGWYMKVHYKPGKSQSTCYNPRMYELQDCYREFINPANTIISFLAHGNDQHHCRNLSF
jgi:hypothetical protein